MACKSFYNSHLHSYIKRALCCFFLFLFFLMFRDTVLLCLHISLCRAATSDNVEFCRCQMCECVCESVCTIWLLNNMQCHHRHLSALLPMWRSGQGRCTANAARQIHIWQPFIAACHVTGSTSSNSFSRHSTNKEQSAWSSSTEVFKAVNVKSLHSGIYSVTIVFTGSGLETFRFGL